MRAAGRESGSSHEDVLLSGLYQQVTDLQEARFEAGYDRAAGLERYRTWLDKHTDGAASPDVIDFGTPAPR